MNEDRMNGRQAETEDGVFSSLINIAGFEPRGVNQQECERAAVLNRGKDRMIAVYLNHSESDRKYTVLFGLPAEETYETDSDFEMFACIIQYLDKSGV